MNYGIIEKKWCVSRPFPSYSLTFIAWPAILIYIFILLLFVLDKQRSGYFYSTIEFLYVK